MRPILIIAGLGLISAAFADGWSQTVVTSSNLRIESSERMGPDGLIPKRYAYPLHQMLDRNPRTTWVLKDPGYPKPRRIRDWDYLAQYFIEIQKDKGVFTDELRLRLGYHKSERLYRLNSRPLGIEVYDEYPFMDKRPKPIRKVKFRDRMEEKAVWLPGRKYQQLYIVFTDIKRGAVDDLCISEMELRDSGRRLIRQDPYLYSTGSDCG